VNSRVSGFNLFSQYWCAVRASSANLFACLFVLVLTPAATVLQAQELLVSHTLSFPRNGNQYVHVKLNIPVNSGQIELSMPSWTPGSYVIRDYAAHVENFQASGEDGRILDVAKVAKNRWRVNTEGLSKLAVSYDVWAGELHVSSSWVSSEFALINGSGIFLYTEESRNWPQEVTVNVPPVWSKTWTSMKAGPGANEFLARDYDELVDSPIVAGNAVDYRFEVDGQGYVLVNTGENKLWDGERSARDVAKLVKEQQKFWGINPFDRDYLFLNFLVEWRGGLEHDFSTVMMSSKWAMRSNKDYVKWLSLVSHEFFHSWNVRRMRPEVLAEYNYDSEVYTRELWLAEGLSSYYDNLLLFRSALIDVKDYFELLATEFRNYETTPGRKIRSAELASFDSWIKHYIPDANSVNSTVSYYRKGSSIGFVADAAIRKETDGKASLDTVMRKMYSLYGPDGPGQGSYPPGAFETVVESVAGPDVRAMIENLLQTTADPDFDQALDWYGLQLDREPGRLAAEKAGGPVPTGFGLTWDEEEYLLIVKNVIQGGAGAAAGILPGDELLAINGSRVTTINLEDRMLRLLPDEIVELTLVRQEQLVALTVRVQNAIPKKYSIMPKPGIRNRQKNRMEAWLGRDLQFSK
jgi:predicted metalloprotease with PDZ domain